MSTAGRVGVAIGLAIDVVVLGYLILRYRQFCTRVRRGALLTALAVLADELVAATLVRWGLVEAFPHAILESEQRLPYAFNRVVTFASVGTRTFDGNHAYTVINSSLGLLGALALIAAAVVLFRSQRLAGLMTTSRRASDPRADHRLQRRRLAVPSPPAGTRRSCSRRTATPPSITSRSVSALPPGDPIGVKTSLYFVPVCIAG